jgi:hypothetical protein
VLPFSPGLQERSEAYKPQRWVRVICQANRSLLLLFPCPLSVLTLAFQLHLPSGVKWLWTSRLYKYVCIAATAPSMQVLRPSRQKLIVDEGSGCALRGPPGAVRARDGERHRGRSRGATGRFQAVQERGRFSWLFCSLGRAPDGSPLLKTSWAVSCWDRWATTLRPSTLPGAHDPLSSRLTPYLARGPSCQHVSHTR